MAETVEVGASWYAALAVFAAIVGYLVTQFFPTAHEAVTSGSAQRSNKKKKKTQSKKTQPADKAAPANDASAGEDEGAPAPAQDAPKKGKNKVLKLRTPQKDREDDAVRQALLNPGGEDDEGFQVAVSKHTLQGKQRVDKMSLEEKKEYLKRREKAEDAKWETAGSKMTRSSNAYSTSHSVTGKKVPAKKQERTVSQVSPEERAAMMKKLSSRKEDLPPASFAMKVSVQGNWYPIAELLATDDFAHAPQMVKCFALSPESCVGGYFIKIGGKEWMGESTADEPWMMSGLLKPYLQLLAGEEGPLTTPLFIDDSTNPTTQLSVKQNADDEDPMTAAVLLLQHLRAPPKVSSVAFKVSFKDFTAQLLKEFELFVEFSRRMSYAVSEVRLKHEALMESNPAKAGRILKGLKETETRLPKIDKTETLFASLQDAVLDKWPDLL
eukprot:TRINITY_DN44925_c0_g1_i1.p1 TRINITY_DN44925_c0_g1~~TRINITY_DN44925_c0_g1_i1.p1  ORF type:complete len:452 (+),score=206.88 TRINITY_DN44925_c0_g1_i1:41-1357(+)